LEHHSIFWVLEKVRDVVHLVS